MVTGIIIIAILLAGFVVLLRQAGSARHPLLQRLREKGIRPGRTELLLCRRPSFVSAGQLMTEREQRFLRRLDRVTDTRQWRCARRFEWPISSEWRPTVNPGAVNGGSCSAWYRNGIAMWLSRTAPGESLRQWRWTTVPIRHRNVSGVTCCWKRC